MDEYFGGCSVQVGVELLGLQIPLLEDESPKVEPGVQGVAWKYLLEGEFEMLKNVLKLFLNDKGITSNSMIEFLSIEYL